MKSDELIKKEVTDELYWDSRIDASKIDVEVSEGTVTLKGTVPSYNAYLAAGNDAWSISGVAMVENKIKVKPTLEVPSDEQVNSNAENVLDWNPSVDASDIDVSVTAGNLTLEGSVDSYWKLSYAADLVSGLTGVLTITNKLSVVPTKDYVDQEIAKDITNAMDRNINLDVEDVDVKVENGQVTLSGTVQDWSAYSAAYNAAAYTAGVVEIDDKLTISA